MSWRDRYTGKGKFRDAEFLVKSSDMVFGRRKVVHEYPQRDIHYVEDLGPKAREFTIDAFVIGPDYPVARDALIEAIEKPGPGTLIHPYLGTMRVEVTNARKRETNAEGGRCQFTLTLILAGENKYPDDLIDTQSVVNSQADKSIADAINDFANTFDVLGLVEGQVTEVEDELAGILNAVDNVVGSATEPLASLIRTPFNLGVALVGSISRIGSMVAIPLRALSLYSSLFNSGDDSPTIPTTTASRKQQAKSTEALHNLVKRTALIEASRSSSQAEYMTYDDAVKVRNILIDELDNQMQAESTDDTIYLSLLDLRVAVTNDISIRGADLSRLETHTPLTTLPALVIAYQLYGDAERESEVITRNNIRHPGFVPGGKTLEVIDA